MKTLLGKPLCYWVQIFSISFSTHKKLPHEVTQSKEPVCRRSRLGKSSELHLDSVQLLLLALPHEPAAAGDAKLELRQFRLTPVLIRERCQG